MTSLPDRPAAPTVLQPAPPIGIAADTQRARVGSPVGGLEVEATREAITAVRWVDDTADADAASGLLAEARQQLVAYFAGRLKVFDLPLAPAGSPFERDIWRLMCDIPYGQTMTYGEMADAVGGVARAVGTACGSNPIPLIIPCHRVLGAGNRMVGYSGRGSVETKRWLLVHEGKLLL
ncbi:methylated-DNA--[protein]-cysteine S-methyltransferase [Vineibacter terrae]|uniref:methylated-DNA--[protein]-cysteine S-methyltransferase n=1 Tax=Vineibacter terrae TaxID=2586908 RepID=UPI002E33CE77|nr:methylated-DNA--[protein]-cysteine S-methyltransferase [Vineibacter terrae]HEX2890904.1 methylated-DNA--[protein]-cysteine S-methyltransferase [Vineibacter terrae]